MLARRSARLSPRSRALQLEFEMDENADSNLAFWPGELTQKQAVCCLMEIPY